MKSWTGEELNQLKEMFDEGYTDREISKVLGRTEKTVRKKRWISGLGKGSRFFWEQKEIDYIKANYMDKTDREIGEVLGRTEEAVLKKRSELHLKKKGWTADEEKVLSQMFWGGSDDEEISKVLNRGVELVGRKRRELGLLKRHLKESVVYDFYRYNEYVTTGTLEEIAAETGVSLKTLENYEYLTKVGEGDRLILVE